MIMPKLYTSSLATLFSCIVTYAMAAHGPMPVKSASLAPTKVVATQLAIERQQSEMANIRQFYYDKPIWLSVHAGSQGVGADAKFGLNEQFSVTIGGSILPLGFNAPLSFQGLAADTKLKATFANAHALLSYYPIYQNTRLKIVPGIGYFFKANGNVDAYTQNDSYRFGDISLSGEEVGMLNSKFNWNGIAPFLGAGWDDVYAMKDMRLSFLVGTYFMSAPKGVRITGTNMLQGNSVNEPVIQSNLRSYRWLPVLQVEFNYSL
jgi:hypothetical protein